MKRTRATRGEITRTIYETTVRVRIFNKSEKEIEIAEKTLHTTKTLSDSEIERKLKKDISDGFVIVDIETVSVNETMYAISIEDFIQHARKITEEEEEKEE